MTVEERDRLIQDVKRVLWNELRGTIPPSIDIMRSITFETAAEKAVDLCLNRTNVEVSNAS